MIKNISTNANNCIDFRFLFLSVHKLRICSKMTFESQSVVFKHTLKPWRIQITFHEKERSER